MSIVSHTFGRVKLTEADATKFRNQITYGRPKAAAKQSVTEGVKLSKSLSENGSVSVRLKLPA